MKPAAYSNTDTPEIEAIQILEGLIDVRRVKTHIARRDKVPNFDGFAELVDEEQRPFGKIDLQVRKIEDDATTATCDDKLIAYSCVNGLPLVYVGVDVKNRKAYWRQISFPMVEMREGNKSCTIRFDSVSDSIGPGSPYFERWVRLAQDFQDRITNYPQLRQQLSDTVKLTSIGPKDRIWFQTFIDLLNHHLDTNYSVIKSLFFADTWKLGVAITSASEESVSFSLYKILKGENAPLVISLPGSVGHLFSDGPTTKPIETGGIPFSFNFFRRESAVSPEKKAGEQIARYVSKIFDQKLLNLSGELICKEYIFNFLDDFHHVLGLDSRDEYTLLELRRGIFVFFPQWYSVAFKRFCDTYADLLRSLPFPHFSAIAHSLIKPTVEEIESRISAGQPPDPWMIRTEEVNFKAFIQALDFLFHKGFDQIVRPYAKKVQRGPWVWNAFSVDSLRTNIPLILGRAHEEYLALTAANQFDSQRLRHASAQTALIYSTNLQEWPASLHPPFISYHLVDNSDAFFQPVVFVDLSNSDASISISNHEIIRNGITRPVLARGSMDAHAFFRRLPLFNICYSWLAEDLSAELDSRFSFTDV